MPLLMPCKSNLAYTDDPGMRPATGRERLTDLRNTAGVARPATPVDSRAISMPIHGAALMAVPITTRAVLATGPLKSLPLDHKDHDGGPQGR